MATPRFLHLSRRLTTITTTAKSSLSAAAAPQFSLLRALSAVRLPITAILPSSSPRLFSTQIVPPPLDMWDHPCPGGKLLPDGCDFKHWLIVFYPPPKDWSRDQIIDFYVKTLAQVVGSEEEARKKIYSVSTKHYFAFGALIDEETSAKFKEIKNVEWVLPDSYMDDTTKDYGGEPFINGQAVPYDPKYHAEWVRNTQWEQSVTASEPGGSPNYAGDQQNMSLNNAGHGQNIPPNNISGNVYGGAVKPEYSNKYNSGPKYQAGEEMPNHAQNGGYQGRNVPERDLPHLLESSLISTPSVLVRSGPWSSVSHQKEVMLASKKFTYIKGESFRLLSWAA